jgi:hypothetical protein
VVIEKTVVTEISKNLRIMKGFRESLIKKRVILCMKLLRQGVIRGARK